jgi:carbon-monoxide dehydrogenase large subunit
MPARRSTIRGRASSRCGTQSPFLVRRYLAQYLGREEAGIRVIAPDVGGGFGPKAGHYPEELVAAVVSEKLGAR